MLTTAKPILQQELYKSTYDAAYDAYMSQFKSNSEAQKYAGEANQAMIDSATRFAKTLADKLSMDMADSIYKFVKEIGIMVTIPPTVIAPPGIQGGPCVGTITMENFKVF